MRNHIKPSTLITLSVGTYQCQADMDQMARVLIFFFMCGVLVCFWYHGNAHLVECVWKSSPIFKFSQEFEKDKYLIFKYLGEFTNEAFQYYTFVCWDVFNYLFNLLTGIGLFRFFISL